MPAVDNAIISRPDRAGLEIGTTDTFTPIRNDGSNDANALFTVANSGQTYLAVHRTSAQSGAGTLVVETEVTVDGLDLPDRAYTVPAYAATGWVNLYGPFPVNVYGKELRFKDTGATGTTTRMQIGVLEMAGA